MEEKSTDPKSTLFTKLLDREKWFDTRGDLLRRHRVTLLREEAPMPLH